MRCRILLVEDEYEIRKGIRYLIDWEQYGFEVIGEAADGEQALGIIEQKEPHIILTDIRMPNMDGVQLTKVMQMRYPSVKVIILSGYNDYDYVRTCFQYGAVDYILKPMLTADDLLRLLEKTAKSLPHFYLEHFSTPSAENILSCILAGAEPKIEPDQEKNLFPGSQYRLLAMDASPSLGNAQDLACCRELLQESVSECFPQRELTMLFFENFIFVLLINTSAELAEMDRFAAEQLVGRMESYFKEMFWVYSKPILEFKDIYPYWKNDYAEKLKKRFYFRHKQFVEENEIELNCFSASWDKRRFEILLNSGRFFDALNELAEGIQDNLSARNVDEMELKALASNATYQTVSFLEEKSAPKEGLTDMRRRFIVDISNARYAEDLLQVVKQIADEVSQYCLLDKRQFDMQILDYIEGHYAEELTLAKLASMFNFSYYYLSAYFGTHYKKSFTEYLNSVRIKKAQQLLHERSLPVAEVSVKVGYTDNSYFSRVFKKYVGVTPTDYRRQFEKEQ